MNKLTVLTRLRCTLLSLLPVCLLLTPAAAQSPLDVGIHFSPQLRYLHSSPTEGKAGTVITSGNDGLAVGLGGGAYLEYEITPNWFVRGGLDLSYKRNHYTTQRSYRELDTVRQGSNLIVYTSIELPVAVIYRFDFLRNDNSFLLGVGTTLNRWNGTPRHWSTFAQRNSLKDAIEFSRRSVTVFGGYEHYLNRTLVLGLEPYLAYVPTRFKLETTTTTRVQLEAGLSVRMRIDN